MAVHYEPHCPNPQPSNATNYATCYAHQAKDVDALRTYVDDVRATATDQASQLASQSSQLKAVESVPPDLLELRRALEESASSGKNEQAKFKMEVERQIGDMRNDTNRQISQFSNATDEKITKVTLGLEGLQTELHHKIATDVMTLQHDVKQLRADSDAVHAAMSTDTSFIRSELDRQVGNIKKEVDSSVLQHKLTEEAEFMQIKDQLRELQRDTSEGINAGMTQVQDELRSVQETVVSHTSSIKQLEVTSTAHGQEISNAKARLDAQETASGNTGRELTDLRNGFQGLKTSMADQPSRLQAMESQVTSTAHAVSVLQAGSTSAAKELEGVRDYIDQVKATTTEQGSTLATLKSEEADHSSRLAAVDRANAEQSAAISGLKGEVRILNHQLHRLMLVVVLL